MAREDKCNRPWAKIKKGGVIKKANATQIEREGTETELNKNERNEKANKNK